MSNLKKSTGYSISAVSVAAAIAIASDRYGEFAAGAESFASWAIPPLVLLSMAVIALVAVRQGHPDTGESNA